MDVLTADCGNSNVRSRRLESTNTVDRAESDVMEIAMKGYQDKPCSSVSVWSRQGCDVGKCKRTEGNVGMFYGNGVEDAGWWLVGNI